MKVVPAILASLLVTLGLYGIGYVYTLFVPRAYTVRIWVPVESSKGAAVSRPPPGWLIRPRGSL